MNRGFRISLPKIHRRFCIGPPKIHRRFRIGPQVTLNLLLPEFHSRWILVYHGCYARKATKLHIWNRMIDIAFLWHILRESKPSRLISWKVNFGAWIMGMLLCGTSIRFRGFRLRSGENVFFSTSMPWFWKNNYNQPPHNKAISQLFTLVAIF